MKNNDEKTKINTVLVTEKACISMSPEAVTPGPPVWLEEQIKSIYILQTFSWHYCFVGKNWEIVGPVCYLRLKRRALSTASRSSARILPLSRSSSATFSSTADRLAALRSNMYAPEDRHRLVVFTKQEQICFYPTVTYTLISVTFRVPKSPVLMSLRSWIKLLKVR